MIPERPRKSSRRISTSGQRSGAGFKLLMPLSSFRRLRILFFSRFYERYCARHAPEVLLPTSKPGRPQEFVFYPIAELFVIIVLKSIISGEIYPLEHGRNADRKTLPDCIANLL